VSSDPDPTDMPANDLADTDIEQQYADAFNQETDPLAQYNDAFQELPDPFEVFIQNVLLNRDTITDSDTIYQYRLAYRQWRTHMNAIAPARHPACPTTQHVKRFIEWRREVHGNSRRTIKARIAKLSQAYEYWQDKNTFPHPPDWNPFTIGRKEATLGDNSDKTYHDLTLPELQSEFGATTNIRRRGIIGSQLKLGLRAGEVCNLCLSEIHLSHYEIQQFYSDLGTHPALEDYSGVIYIPHTRDGNKSSNPRLLPIDDELRWLLLRHLLTRPQVDEPWVFLSNRTFTKLTPQGVNREWKAAFHPKYADAHPDEP